MTHRTFGKTSLKSFARDEDGAITVWSIFLTLCILFMGGLAIDVNNAVQSEVQLQGTADAAGHAGVVELFKNGSGNVAAKAIEVAELNMPTERYGNVLVAADVEIGSWDAENRIFTPGGSEYAVRVTTRRLESRSNALATFLLRLVGLDELQLNTSSIWAYGGGLCPGPGDDGNGMGFFALGVVDMQSQNTFLDGFCIHGETGVKVSTDNDVRDAYVTMDNFYTLRGPSGNNATSVDDYAGLYGKNPGLEDAHGSYSYKDVLDAYFAEAEAQMNALFNNPAANTGSDLIPDTVSLSEGVEEHFVQKNGATLGDLIEDGDLAENTIHKITCTPNGNKYSGITIDNDVALSDMVIVTNCEVKFNSGASFEHGALISTADTKNNSINGPSGTRFGSEGFCPKDGLPSDEKRTNIVTAGDAHLASGAEFHGLHMVVLGEVHNIAANASAGGGINLMAKGDIDVTTGGTWGLCGLTPGSEIEEPYFRMVG